MVLPAVAEQSQLEAELPALPLIHPEEPAEVVDIQPSREASISSFKQVEVAAAGEVKMLLAETVELVEEQPDLPGGLLDQQEAA